MYGLYKFLHKSVGLGCERLEGGLVPRPISAVVPKKMAALRWILV